jgi:hypothetical protein
MRKELSSVSMSSNSSLGMMQTDNFVARKEYLKQKQTVELLQEMNCNFGFNFVKE